MSALPRKRTKRTSRDVCFVRIADTSRPYSITTVHPKLCLDTSLTDEQAGNGNHDSSDECEQARKQHNVTQEHTHTRAFPRLPGGCKCGHTAADSDRTDTLSVRGSPQSQFPWKQIRRRGIRFLFFKVPGPPQAPRGQHQDCTLLVLLTFSQIAKFGTGHRHSALLRQRGNRGKRCGLPLAAITLAAAIGFNVLAGNSVRRWSAIGLSGQPSS